ncbi:hypothetical protein ARALYDRAFT_917500 [Arabidopsis lyrata subsp. lyrata]|uniref:Uncharacterized protein n=1 Tax=Arabidopsis lyrata subsp. lyrata TaxID=81972 RepID=D7MS39_ARALL|nr:hypothetical protein ARALYDRAFT_917500 [Arabidopsis lyrata subsp. lyrata]
MWSLFAGGCRCNWSLNQRQTNEQLLVAVAGFSRQRQAYEQAYIVDMRYLIGKKLHQRSN